MSCQTMSLKNILMFLKFVTVLVLTRSFEKDGSFITRFRKDYLQNMWEKKHGIGCSELLRSLTS